MVYMYKYFKHFLTLVLLYDILFCRLQLQGSVYIYIKKYIYKVFIPCYNIYILLCRLQEWEGPVCQL